MSGLDAHRAAILDYVGDPSQSGHGVRWIADGLLVVEEGRVREVGEYEALRPQYEGARFFEHTGHCICPGFIDAHVHYPQTRIIASYGEQLLEWLQQYAFPEECRFASRTYADQVATEFVAELLRHGTTTAVALCTVHAHSVDALASAAAQFNLRLILGKVLMDRNAPAELCETLQQSYDESKALIERYHGLGRLLYAITPRFAPTSSPEQLRLAADLHEEFPTTYVHTHLSENRRELDWVRQLFPGRKGYADVYEHYGLMGPQSIFAHGIHLAQGDLAVLNQAQAALAFCPTSNLFLGSGLFPLEDVQAANIPVALATDVGGGTSFSMLQTFSEAYKVLQLQGQSMSAHQGLYLLTLGAARALRLDDKIGNFEAGKEADFVVLDFRATPLLQGRTDRAQSLEERLFALLMLGDDRAIRSVYAAGKCVHRRDG